MITIKFEKRVIEGNAVEYLQELHEREFKVLQDLGAQIVEAREHRYTETRSMDWDFSSRDTYQLDLVDVTFRVQAAEGDMAKVQNFLDLLLELDYEFKYFPSLS